MGLFTISGINSSLASLFKGRPSAELVESRKSEAKEDAEKKPEASKTEAKAAEPATEKADVSKPDNNNNDAANTESNTESKTNADSDSESDIDVEVDHGFSDDEAGEQKRAEKPAEKKKLDAEAEAERAARTVLVKNVPSECITEKKVLRQFKRVFGGPAIESLRFRSIAMSEVMPRKIAYIKHKLHPQRDNVNCYIVYRNMDGVHNALQTLNGVEFEGRHLFVDSAQKPRERKPKQTVFIGNLNFEASEEDLFKHFAECGTIENLRIVRDRKFNVGKGFAYVQFDDPSAVQIALLKNGSELDGRKLRVVPCSGKKSEPKHASSKAYREKQTTRSQTGNPKKRKAASQDTGKNAKNAKRDVVIEGVRAREGEAVELNKKRRHGDRARKRKNASMPKRARK